MWVNAVMPFIKIYLQKSHLRHTAFGIITNRSVACMYAVTCSKHIITTLKNNHMQW